MEGDGNPLKQTLLIVCGCVYESVWVCVCEWCVPAYIPVGVVGS